METRTMRPRTYRHGRTDDAYAFVPDVGLTHARLQDGDAEAAGEEMIACATSGEYVAGDAEDEMTVEEIGGPFLEYIVMPEEEEGAE